MRVSRILGDLVEYRDETSKVKIGDKNGLKSYSFMMRHNVSEEKLKDKFGTGHNERVLLDALGRLNKNQVAEEDEFDVTWNKHRLEIWCVNREDRENPGDDALLPSLKTAVCEVAEFATWDFWRQATANERLTRCASMSGRTFGGTSPQEDEYFPVKRGHRFVRGDGRPESVQDLVWTRDTQGNRAADAQQQHTPNQAMQTCKTGQARVKKTEEKRKGKRGRKGESRQEA